MALHKLSTTRKYLLSFNNILLEQTPLELSSAKHCVGYEKLVFLLLLEGVGGHDLDAVVGLHQGLARGGHQAQAEGQLGHAHPQPPRPRQPLNLATALHKTNKL